MAVKLELYKVFKEVAEAGNITAAAQALYISQSAVSQSIKQLEGDLQTRLFARNSRGVTLTADGKLLYEYVRSAIGLLETGEAKLSQTRELQMGHLTIGASDTVTSQFLLPYLDSFHKQYPAIHIQIVSGRSHKVLGLLQSGKVDIAFASRSVTTTNLKGALAKLDRTARRRCAVTMVANSSPRYDLHVMNAIGASVTCSNGFVYAFNILIQMGALPQVTYFESPRRDTFDSLEAGVADFSRMLEHGNEDKIDRLRDYIAQHMIENPHAGEPGSKGVPQGRYMLDHVRKVRWAFIAWEPVSAPSS